MRYLAGYPARSSIARLRMIELLTELAGRSHGSLSVLENVGLLESLQYDLGSTDVLTRFNIIEILSEVSGLCVLSGIPHRLFHHRYMTTMRLTINRWSSFSSEQQLQEANI